MWLFALVGCGGVGLVSTKTDGETVEAGADTSSGTSAGDDAPPVEVALLTHTWSVDLGSVSWVAPPGITSLVALSDSTRLLFNVKAESSDSLSFAVSLAAADGGQNPCERVVDLPAARWDNPRWTIDEPSLPLTMGGSPVDVKDAWFSAVVTPDAEEWTDGVLEGTLDARELAPGLGADIDVCQLIADMGGGCVPCDDGDVSCFEVRVEDLWATTLHSSFDPNVDDDAC